VIIITKLRLLLLLRDNADQWHALKFCCVSRKSVQLVGAALPRQLDTTRRHCTKARQLVDSCNLS
jgi:hypothetical protein